MDMYNVTIKKQWKKWKTDKGKVGKIVTADGVIIHKDGFKTILYSVYKKISECEYLFYIDRFKDGKYSGKI